MLELSSAWSLWTLRLSKRWTQSTNLTVRAQVTSDKALVLLGGQCVLCPCSHPCFLQQVPAVSAHEPAAFFFLVLNTFSLHIHMEPLSWNERGEFHSKEDLWEFVFYRMEINVNILKRNPRLEGYKVCGYRRVFFHLKTWQACPRPQVLQ